MKRPAVFFDRDNTLIHNDGFLADPAKVVLVEGAAEAVARARAMGYATVTISNQSGVARGMFEEEDVERVNARMDELLAADHPQATIDRHEFCPFHPEGNIDVYRRESDRRKPAPGMLLSAAQKLDIELKTSWVIGDMERDMQAGRAAGCTTILLRLPGTPDEEQAGQDASAQTGLVRADFTVHSLQEALDVIEKNGPSSSAAAAAAPAADKPWMAAAEPERAAKPEAPAPPPAVDFTSPPPPPASPASGPIAPPVAPPVSPQVAPPVVSPVAPPVQPPQEVAEYRPPVQEAVEYHPPLQASLPPPPLPPQRTPASPPAGTYSRLEQLTEQLLIELRRRHEQDHADFSVTKLLAGIAQVMALAAVFIGYMWGQGPEGISPYMLTAIFLETLTIALLVMGRQK